MRTTRAAATGGLVALSLALAVCGTGTLNGQPPPGGSGPPKAAVLAAMSQTKSTSYKFSMNLDITGLGQASSAFGGTGAGPGGSMSMSGSGEFSASQQAMAMAMSLPAGLSSTGASGSMSEIAFLGTGKVYVSLSGDGPSAKWYSLDIGSLGKLGGLASLAQGPAGYLSGFAGDVVSASRIGTAEIGGVATTEYAVTENLQAIITRELGNGGLMSLIDGMSNGMPASVRSSVSQMMQSVAAAMPKYLTSDVWLDGAGHMRKMYVSLPLGKAMAALFADLAKVMPAAASGVSGPGLATLGGMFSNFAESVTMLVSDVGGTVDVTAPPASQVVAGNPFSASASASASASGSASASTSTSTAS